MSAVSVSGTASVVRSPDRRVDAVASSASRPSASSIRTVSTAYSGIAVRARHDRPDGALRQPGHQAREQLAHGRLGQRLQEERS